MLPGNTVSPEAPEAKGEVYNITNGEPRALEIVRESLTGLSYLIKYRKFQHLSVRNSSSLEFIYKTFEP